MKEGFCQTAVKGTASEEETCQGRQPPSRQHPCAMGQDARQPQQPRAKVRSGNLDGQWGCQAGEEHRASVDKGRRDPGSAKPGRGLYGVQPMVPGQALHRGGLLLPQKCSYKTGPEGRFQRRAQDCESGHSTPEKTNGVGAPAAAQQVCACVDGRGPLHTAPRGSWSLDVGTRSTCSQVGMSIQPHCARV